MEAAVSPEKDKVQVPPVPIKTYKWEDVKRARQKGAYPWTHWNKDPFDEEVDPSDFTMEAMKKSKSASTIGKESGVTIEDVTESELQKDTLKVTGDEKYSKTEMTVDLADSSGDDNISQYLDKDDKEKDGVSERSENVAIEVEPGTSKDDDLEDLSVNGRKRAKSEEPKRKRKHSIESSYSRISLSKLGVMKRLREAKDKIEKIQLPKMPKMPDMPKMPKMPDMPKIPKLPSFKKSKPESKAAKETESKKPEPKKETKKLEAKKDEQPVYIYIPLKPPPGETDEFSKFAMEIEEKVEGPEKEKEEPPEPETPSSPESPGKSGVQMIILTAPSDDELLDGPDIPETPSDADPKGFNKERFEDLKYFAKNIVEEISPSREQTPSKDIPIDDEVQDDTEPKIVGETLKSEVTAEVGKDDSKEGGDSKEADSGKEINLPKQAEVQEEASKIAEKDSIEKQETKVDDESSKAADENAKDKESEGSDETKAKPKKKIVKKIVKKRAPEVKKSPDAEKTEVKHEDDKDKIEKMVVDEEDGLKEPGTEQPVKQETEVQPILKAEGETSPKPKKKVSFKKKPKAIDDYETIQARKSEAGKSDPAKSEAKDKSLEATQSMSVDEEKQYLDEKIIKTTSLEEDYNKWSKLGDHEYEPINPPADEGLQTARPLQVTKMEVDVKDRTIPSGSPRNLKKLDSEDSQNLTDTPEEFLSAQEMQDRMENKFFNQPKTTTPKSVLKPSTSTAESSSSATTPQDKAEPMTTKAKLQGQGRKIKAAFNTQAGKFKTRMQSIKKPTISLPTRPKLKINKPNITMPKMPNRPKFTKPKMPTMPKLKMPEKPKITMPKMPEKLNFPSFTLPKRGTAKRSMNERQLSTESNAGDSKKKIFDFSIVPRMFSRQKKGDDFDDDAGAASQPVESATVPRAKKSRWAQKIAEIKQKAAVETEDTRKTKEVEKKVESKKPKSDSPVYIRIPLHSQESMDKEEALNGNNEASHIRYNQDIDIDDAYDKENKEIHKVSPFSSGFKQAERWKHGTFHQVEKSLEDDEHVKDIGPEETTTDLERQDLEHRMQPREYGRSEKPRPYTITDLDSGNSESLSPERRFDSPNIHSSSSFGDIHRRGVLEEINPDEFFLRQKGISQDNIEVGAYLSSEIREAFKDPTEAMHYENESFEREGDMHTSDHSLNGSSKPKLIKKPKRKKTPTVSREKLSFEQETEPEEYLREVQPTRPKRRSKKKKKQPKEDIVPYQETIHVDQPHEEYEQEIMNENILHEPQSRYYYNDRISTENVPQMYENELMKGIEHPEIMVSDTYHRDFYKKIDIGFVDEEENGFPAAPPRKQRSLKSLNASEHDSIMGEFSSFKELPPHHPDLLYRMVHNDYIIPDSEEAPERPRRTRSRTRSQSRATSQPDEDQISREVAYMYENQQPCVEEPCVQDVRDSMGYAVIDKNKMRDPPLPPSRIPPTPPRRRKAKLKKPEKSEQRFATAPRPFKTEGAPIRPLRNYSTLGPSVSKKKRSETDLSEQDKENIDISQYIEIEEPNRDLQSGEVIQKMRDRPLPAPPRPPRKSRESSKALSDITNGQDFDDDMMPYPPEETEVSTQTEPLPEDFGSEELIRDHHDNVPPPAYEFDNEETITHGSLVIERFDDSEIIPTLPQSDTIESRERIVTVEKDYGEDETSEIPEEFKYLRDPPHPDEETTEIPLDFHELKSPDSLKAAGDMKTEAEIKQTVDSMDLDKTQADQTQDKKPEPTPRTRTRMAVPFQQPGEESASQVAPQVIERIIERPVPVAVLPDSTTEVELLKAAKLQVGDLDVNRLTVNELMASKITVSEIDSASIQVSEINSQGGNLVVGGIELPSSFIRELLEKLQEQAGTSSQKPPATEQSESSEQKKTSTDVREEDLEQIPERPPRRKSEINLDALDNIIVTEVEEDQEQHLLEEESEEQPERPPRLKPNKNLDISLENLVSVEELRLEVPPELPQQPKFEISTENLALEEDVKIQVQKDTEQEVPVEEEPKSEPAAEPLKTIESEETDEKDQQQHIPEQHLEELDVEHKSSDDLVGNVEETEMQGIEEIEAESQPVADEEKCDNMGEGKSQDLEIGQHLEEAEIEHKVASPHPILQRLESELDFEINSESALIEHLRNRHFLQRGYLSGDFSDMPPLESDPVQMGEVLHLIAEEEDKEMSTEDVGKQSFFEDVDKQASPEDVNVQAPVEDVHMQTPVEDASSSVWDKPDSDVPASSDENLNTLDGSFAKQDFLEEDVDAEKPIRPPRKKSLTETEIADIESQIIKSLEDEMIMEQIEPPQRPPRQNDPYDIDPKILAEIQSSFIKEVQEMQQAPQRPNRQRGGEAKETDSEENLQTKSETTEKDLELTKSESDNIKPQEVSEEPPPRPPQPFEAHPDLGYIPSQPPPSFYDLRSPVFIDFVDEDDIPLPPRRRRQKQQPVSQSSSDEVPQTSSTRRRHKTPEPSIPQLAGQLTRACGTAIDRSLKRLILHITNNVMQNSDGRQDLHVIIVMLLVLIAGLILLGFGDGKTIHHHHWEYFNPPKNL